MKTLQHDQPMVDNRLTKIICMYLVFSVLSPFHLLFYFSFFLSSFSIRLPSQPSLFLSFPKCVRFYLKPLYFVFIFRLNSFLSTFVHQTLCSRYKITTKNDKLTTITTTAHGIHPHWRKYHLLICFEILKIVNCCITSAF